MVSLPFVDTESVGTEARAYRRRRWQARQARAAEIQLPAQKQADGKHLKAWCFQSVSGPQQK